VPLGLEKFIGTQSEYGCV